MNNQDFINQLTTQLKPVTIVKKPSQNFITLTLISFVWLVFGISFIGFRTDISETISEFSFWATTILVLILASASAFSSLVISIPDRHKNPVYVAPVLTAVLWICYLWFLMLSNTYSHPGEGILCVRDIIVFSILPTILLAKMVSQGSVLQKGLAGTFSLLGGSAFGALGTQFTCRDDFGLHIFVWHAIPVSILVASGYFLGKKIYNLKRV